MNVEFTTTELITDEEILSAFGETTILVKSECLFSVEEL